MGGPGAPVPPRTRLPRYPRLPLQMHLTKLAEEYVLTHDSSDTGQQISSTEDDRLDHDEIDSSEDHHLPQDES